MRGNRPGHRARSCLFPFSLCHLIAVWPWQVSSPLWASVSLSSTEGYTNSGWAHMRHTRTDHHGAPSQTSLIQKALFGIKLRQDIRILLNTAHQAAATDGQELVCEMRSSCLIGLNNISEWDWWLAMNLSCGGIYSDIPMPPRKNSKAEEGWKAL